MVKMVSRLATAPAPDLEDDQAAGAVDFGDLAAEAAAIDSGAPLQPSTAVALAPVDPAVVMAGELFALLKLPRNLAQKRFAWWPDFQTVWSDDQLNAIAQALAGVCVHMGWTIDQVMGKWGPWLALAVAAGLPAYVTWDAIQDRRAAHEQQAAQAKKQATGVQHSGHPQ